MSVKLHYEKLSTSDSGDPDRERLLHDFLDIAKHVTLAVDRLDAHDVPSVIEHLGEIRHALSSAEGLVFPF